ncbi:helix-turn-helix transcriptional regulator [Micromonospora sp. LZ34]
MSFDQVSRRVEQLAGHVDGERHPVRLELVPQQHAVSRARPRGGAYAATPERTHGQVLVHPVQAAQRLPASSGNLRLDHPSRLPGAVVYINSLRSCQSATSVPLPTVNPVELVGVAEIREMLGNVSRQRASVIANQRNFPEPIAVLAMGKVWRKSDVEKWIRQHRPELTTD